MQLFGQDLSEIAANAGYILTISALVSLFIRNLFVKPYEKRRKKEQEALEKRQNEFQVKIFETFAEELKPFQDSVDALNEVLTNFQRESKSDRDNLNKIAEVNTRAIGKLDGKVDQHNERLIVLEVKTGIKKLGYRETYGEEE